MKSEERRMTIDELKTSCSLLLKDNILSFWLDRMQDGRHGGWYGRMTGKGCIMRDVDKGAILHARLLWTLSAAYRVLHERAYLDAATRTKDYLIDHFIDTEHGGVYWSLDYKGQPKDTKKQFYAISFAIYGLSEYVRATGDHEALVEAVNLFRCIEEHGRDDVYGGYIEAATRDWQPIGDMRLSEKDENYPKSQNTHLHIMEAYTNLYRVWQNRELEQALRQLLDIFRERILNPKTFHLDLFFDMDWTRRSCVESYGHDIECSWLMHETALVLGDKDVLREVEPIVKRMANSLTPSPSQSGDGSIYMSENGLCTEAVWWVQAEAVVGWVNLYQHFGDEAALRKAMQCYGYILDHLVDYGMGEWYWSIRADGSVNLDDDHAGFWKCPYHNGRMCLEIIERAL